MGQYGQQYQYQQQYQQQQQQQQQGGGGQMAGGVVDSVFFEYKGKDGNVHGPYGASQMQQWARQGYFDGEQAVMMRKVSKEQKVRENMRRKGRQRTKKCVR